MRLYTLSTSTPIRISLATVSWVLEEVELNLKLPVSVIIPAYKASAPNWVCKFSISKSTKKSQTSSEVEDADVSEMVKSGNSSGSL